jgi:hypothetical protein
VTPAFDSYVRKDEDAGNPWLRLYVAGATPNSARAKQNLLAALRDLGSVVGSVELTIVDVFKHSRRARTDGIIVTPTLVCGGRNRRLVMMGDLANVLKLTLMLRAFILPR